MMKKLFLLFYILILIGLESCTYQLHRLTLNVNQEKIISQGTFEYVAPLHTKKSVKIFIKKFENICDINKVEHNIKIMNDTTISFKVIIPDFETANRLNDNFKNTNFGTLGFNSADFTFMKEKNNYHIHADMQALNFIKEGTFVIKSQDGGLKANPKYNNDMIKVHLLSETMVIYEIFEPVYYKDSTKSLLKFDIYYPQKVPTPEKPNVLWAFIKSLFEEHLWTTISAILGSIISFKTIIDFLKKKNSV